MFKKPIHPYILIKLQQTRAMTWIHPWVYLAALGESDGLGGGSCRAEASILLVRCSERVRWILHRKEPGWVVGEQRQLVLLMLVWRDSPPEPTSGVELPSLWISIFMIPLSFIICCTFSIFWLSLTSHDHY